MKEREKFRREKISEREREERNGNFGGLGCIYMRELRPLFECPWILNVTEKDSGSLGIYGGVGGGFWGLGRGSLGILGV